MVHGTWCVAYGRCMHECESAHAWACCLFLGLALGLYPQHLVAPLRLSAGHARDRSGVTGYRVREQEQIASHDRSPPRPMRTMPPESSPAEFAPKPRVYRPRSLPKIHLRHPRQKGARVAGAEVLREDVCYLLVSLDVF